MEERKIERDGESFQIHDYFRTRKPCVAFLSIRVFHRPQCTQTRRNVHTKQGGAIKKKKRERHDNYQGVVPIVSAHSPPLARGNSRSSSWSSSSVLFAALPVEQPCARHSAAYPKFAGHTRDSSTGTNGSASHLSSGIAATNATYWHDDRNVYRKGTR